MKPFARSLLPIVFLLISPFAAAQIALGLTVNHLRCENLVDPLGIEDAHPRLSWQVESNERGQLQTAYRILVASNETDLKAGHGDLWDSGKVMGDQTAQIPYAGKDIEPKTACVWKIKAWDKEGRESDWSAPARWNMGLPRNQNWEAEWISQSDSAPLHTDRKSLYLPPARYYRKNFKATKPIKRAMAYVSALGLYELHVNGKRVGDSFLTPGWSDYVQRAYYNTFDVTALVNSGENAIGAIVADGWYSGYVGYGLLVGYGPNKVGRYFYGKTPAIQAQLEIEYTDGTREVIASNPTWKVSDKGPIREADIIMGESFDAQREQRDWCTPGFNAAGWADAIPAKDNGSTKAIFSDVTGDRDVELGFRQPKKMQAYPGPAVRIVREIKAVGMNENKPGVFIYDLGENVAGVIRLKVKGAKGTKVQIRYGEMLHPDGRLMTENLRRARATDYYTLHGDPDGETWTPRFTYHGFQYVELTGLADKPGMDAVTGLVMHSDTPLTSSFECSDPIANQLFKNVVRTQLANFVDIPTDCPQRDERLGWMGDAQTYVRTATYNADVEAFFTKWLDDVEESQRSFGSYPDYAPYPMAHGEARKSWGTAWTDAGIICPWTIWKVYGDTRVIERHYESMKRFMEFRMATSPKYLGVSIGNPWGDWLSLGEITPVEYVDACFYAYSTKLMADMAGAIGRDTDAKTYAKLLTDITTAFNKEYVKPDGSLKVETQTAYVLALSMGMLPAKFIQPASDHLAGMIERNGFRMATGFLGTKPLLPVLTATGHHDLAVRLFQSRKFPSWGYEVANGATSVWERWDSYTKEDAFGKHNAAMNSFSHYSFGAVCEWMFESLAGIDTDGPGFKHIVLRPGPPSAASNPDNEPIDRVRAEYDSIHGKIISDWKLNNGKFELNLTIPANTTATVYLPTGDASSVKEGDQTVRNNADIQMVGEAGGRVKLKIRSGTYRFTAEVGNRSF